MRFALAFALGAALGTAAMSIHRAVLNARYEVLALLTLLRAAR